MNVYDFDNTIYDGESGIDFFFFLMKKKPSLIKYIPKVTICFIKYKLHRITIQTAHDKYADAVEKAIRNFDNFQEEICKFWDRNMHKIKPNFAERIKDNDLILSASPEATIREVCERLNIKNYIGSKIDLETGKIHFICYRENKVSAFREMYPDTVIENFYTDSMNDKPLIDIANHAFLVKKNKILQLK